MQIGKIVQVMGPVVDVEFAEEPLPLIKSALQVDNHGKKAVMEVSQHLGGNMVRCIMLSASEGLQKDMPVLATGAGIEVPVGEQNLGRLFNVLGDTIDGGEQITGAEEWEIHRKPPKFTDQNPVQEILETGIKVIDLIAPYAKGGKVGLFGGAGVGKTVLLNKFAELAERTGWEVIEFEASKHDESTFRQSIFSKFRAALLHLSPRRRWGERARHAAEVLSSFVLSVDQEGTFSVTWDVDPSEGYADHGDLGLDLTDVFLAVGEVAREKGTGIVVLIDEVQFLTAVQLESLIQAVHKSVQKKLPVTFVGAGLPQIAELAGDAKSYAERLFKFPRIDSLAPEDARRAIIEPARAEGATFTDDAADLAVSITHGYPYFLQELGYQAWIIARNDIIGRDDVDAADEGEHHARRHGPDPDRDHGAAIVRGLRTHPAEGRQQTAQRGDE